MTHSKIMHFTLITCTKTTHKLLPHELTSCTFQLTRCVLTHPIVDMSGLPSHHHTPLLEIRTPPGDCIHCWWGGVLLTVLLNCMEQLVWQPRANPMLYYKQFTLLARTCLPPACHQCAFIHRILEWPFDPPLPTSNLVLDNVCTCRYIRLPLHQVTWSGMKIL